ncbi:hypothetical protein LOD99_14135 [Oopsacas minuta]|uniref:Uncharacterized protein n=1 Tax=Oopsacas minuta TaxID=111878 RepID=A0AAV7KKQ0_9METZ|nr:hypothetical protein LOD99_14135 [Oopsacas minuta]
MAKSVGKYKVLANPNQSDKDKQEVIGESDMYKMEDYIALSDFRGVKIESGRNWDYSFEKKRLHVRGLDCGSNFSVTHKDWNDIKIVDIILNGNLVYLLIVQNQHPNTLSIYILTLNGEIVTKNITEFGTRNKAWKINNASFVTDSQSVCLLIKTISLSASKELERVRVTTGSTLILMNERVWYECCLKDKRLNIQPSKDDSPLIIDDDLFYLQQNGNRPRILQLYSLKNKSPVGREIVLQLVNEFKHSEEMEANLISSTYCIDYKHNKILVPYTRLRGFFNHELILRMFSMNGLIEREEIIWECEKCQDIGDSNIFPIHNFSTWSWPFEPINIVLTDNGGVLITWFSGSARSGSIFSTLTKLY